MSDSRKVFISYANSDYSRVAPLATELRAVGLQPWVDRDRIDDFDAIEPALSLAIRQCDAFIVCLSSAYLERPATQWELCEAFATFTHPSDHILVVRLDGYDLAGADSSAWLSLRDLRGIPVHSTPSGDERQIPAVAKTIASRVSAITSDFERNTDSASQAFWPSTPPVARSFAGRIIELLAVHSLLVSNHIKLHTGDVSNRGPVQIIGFGGVGKSPYLNYSLSCSISSVDFFMV